jgi:DtxR family Mn-dependent transcriptional regulator
MYLRTIYELIEEGVPPLRARIAERLDQSGPTVSETVSRMERDGLLTVGSGRRIILSSEGAALAMTVMRRHRLAERLLIDVIGLPWPYVHEEACKWEHVMGEMVEERITAILGDPDVSPYGTTIPRPGETADEAGGRFRRGVVALESILPADDDGASATRLVRLARIGEFAQRDHHCLDHLDAAGIRPGQEITAARNTPSMTITLTGPDGAVCRLDEVWANHLFVTPL